MLERKDNGVPSGKIIPIDGSDFDFMQLVNFGEKHRSAIDINLKEMACFDHCYVLNKGDILTPKAILVSKGNQVKMSLFTNQPALQLYTGVALDDKFKAYQVFV